MAVFGVYTVVHKGFDSVHFSPGDEVPEWAEDLVGDHCLADPSGDVPVVVPDETDVQDDADSGDDVQDASPAEVVLDFTKPKPVRGAKK